MTPSLFLSLAALAALIVVLSFTTSTLEKWKSAGDERALTRTLILWTGVLAIATVLGAIFAGFTLNAIRGQLDEMREASKDTKKAIEATNRLAAAAETSAEEAKSLAGAAQRSTQLGESAQRAWIAPISLRFVNLSDANDPLKVRVTFQNIGREPAKNVKFWTATGFVPLPPGIPPDQWGDLPSWYTAFEVQPKNVCSHTDYMKKAAVLYPSSISITTVDTTRYSIDKDVAIRLGIDPNIQLPVGAPVEI